MSREDIAVQVEQVGKIYRLWDSRRARLAFPIKQLLHSLMPLREANKIVQPQGFREFNALDNISFEIKQGESWGFVGMNGSGKSTLLKIISGNLRPSSGRVEVNGKVVILDYGSGFSGEFTGKENIYIKAALLGLKRKQIAQRYQSIVDFAEIGDFINQPVKTYSSGMMSRLGFAIMAHVDADIIITDEALAVGDVFFVQKCMAFIRDFLKKGTFLFVSHSISDVVSLCQKAIWLEHGNIRAIGTAAKVARAYLNRKNIRSTAPLCFNEDENDNAMIEDELIPKEMILGFSSADAKEMKVLPTQPLVNAVLHDARLKYLTTSVQIVHVPTFEIDSNQDKGGATITQIVLSDGQDKPLTQMMGGESVTLKIDVAAHIKLNSPVIIFQVLDRLGQILFADNSYLSAYQQPFSVNSHDHFTTAFKFNLPLLPAGSYVIRAAVAIVSANSEIKMLHTVNNALALHGVASGPRHGLVGIPMLSIKMKCKHVVNEG